MSLANDAVGVMTGASLAVSIIGQSLAQARGLLSKHAIKQLDRKRCLSPIPVELQEQLAIHCDKALQAFGAKLCKRLVRRSDA